jgi:hypothetical protein
MLLKMNFLELLLAVLFGTHNRNGTVTKTPRYTTLDLKRKLVKNVRAANAMMKSLQQIGNQNGKISELQELSANSHSEPLHAISVYVCV